MHDVGRRERNKQATRVALRDAALRLAMEHGPENVRVSDIADAAGVSPRTYNNYFSSREQAIVDAVTAEREQRIISAILGRPAETGLSDAVLRAIVEHYADPSDQAQDVLLMITNNPALRASYVDRVAVSEDVLTDALFECAPGMDPLTARVLAASVGAAVRVAVEVWLSTLSGPASSAGLVVPTGPLTDQLQAALAALAPAIDSATSSTRQPDSR